MKPRRVRVVLALSLVTVLSLAVYRFAFYTPPARIVGDVAALQPIADGL